MQFDYFVPTKTLSGKGQPSNPHSQKLLGRKALIVISSGKSTHSDDYLSGVETQLDLTGVSYAVFDKILPNPIKPYMMEGAVLARFEGCDSAVDLGGGSNIDVAKAIVVMVANEGDYWGYIPGGSGQRKSVLNDPLPIAAIATTVGTGIGVDSWTVTTKEDTNEEIGLGYEKTFPVLSIADPDLMLTAPPHLTAHQGFDALFHNMEGCLARTADPISDLFALKAIELVGKSFVKAVVDGADKVARADVALTSTPSGMVESLSSYTSEYGLKYVLSAFHHEFPHGAGLIIISKAYYTYFANTCACDEQMIVMAKALGKTDASSVTDSVQALCDLQSTCGMTELKMSDYGVDGANLKKYADNTRQTMGGLFLAGPVRLSREDNIRILQESFQ